MHITSDADLLLIARSFYHNRAGNTELQFRNDLRNITYLQRELVSYTRGEEYSLQRMLNLYITLTNLFGVVTDLMLRYSMPQDLHPMIAVFPVVLKGKTYDPDCFSHKLYNDLQSII